MLFLNVFKWCDFFYLIQLFVILKRQYARFDLVLTSLRPAGFICKKQPFNTDVRKRSYTCWPVRYFWTISSHTWNQHECFDWWCHHTNKTRKWIWKLHQNLKIKKFPNIFINMKSYIISQKDVFECFFRLESVTENH